MRWRSGSFSKWRRTRYDNFDSWCGRLKNLGKLEKIIDEYGRTYSCREFLVEVLATMTWQGLPAKSTPLRNGSTQDEMCFTYHPYEFC